MYFEIISDIREPETIAQGSGIRELNRLRKIHGQGRWRKRKGFATIQLATSRFMKTPTFVICTDNSGYEASLEPRKLYEVVQDEKAKKYGQIRVIDESGEDYLYPNSFFIPIVLPQTTASQIAQIA